MKPTKTTISEKKLIGMRLNMSFADNKTPQLFKMFMPRKKEITNKLNTDSYSMQIFDQSIPLQGFNPTTKFEKWAAVEVSDFENIPEGMEQHTLSGGKYAVFTHKGPASSFTKTFQYIFGTWLPHSEYKLDDREHFEILKKGYSPIDPNAEETVWIPIK